MSISATSSVTLPSGQSVCLDIDTSAGGWAFGSPQDAYVYFAAGVEVNDQAPMPPGLATRRSPWQVGFIQNVVSETLIVTYDGVAPIRLSVSTPCLDASPSGAPWFCGRVSDVLHFGQIQGVNSFWYQGTGKPVAFTISMADWPRFTVYNFLGGGCFPASAGAQIRSVECTRVFRTWIAAREETSPRNLASSYLLVQMTEFAIRVTTTLDVGGANPLFRNEYRAALAGTGRPLPPFAGLDVAAEYGGLAGGGFVQRSISWGPPAPGIRPVIVPPLANELYPQQLNAQNHSVSPQSLSLMTVTRCL